MILLINACVRAQSRTKRLADDLISRIRADGTVKEIRLEDVSFPVVDEAYLRERDRLIGAGELDAPVFAAAREYASADTVVVAAPFWDLSFPASLKQYFEQINVPEITFRYSEDGVPQGLCRAKTLYYVTTAGGPIVSEEFGYGYVRALAQSFHGIRDVRLICAEGLDTVGADAEGILRKAMKEQV